MRMKKRVLLGIAMLGMMGLSVVGCGKKEQVSVDGPNPDAPAAREAVQEEGDQEAGSQEAGSQEAGSQEENLQEPETATEPQKDYLEVYAPILSENISVIRDGYDSDKQYKYVSNGMVERAMYGEPEILMDSLGYVLQDFSGDGVPELLIGESVSYGAGESDQQGYILGGYTVKDDELICFFDGMTHCTYQWMGEDHFYYLASLSATITMIGQNHVSGDATELIWDDFYFSDDADGKEELSIYHNTIGAYDVASSEKVDMTEEEFYSIGDTYQSKCKMLSWTSLSSVKVQEKKEEEAEKTAKEEAYQGGDSLSIEELDAIAKGLGNVCASTCADFDYDGVFEEFAATGQQDEMGGYLLDAVWFIAGDGTVTKVGTDFKGLSMYEANDYYMDWPDQKKGFFYADCGGYGSGWLTFVYGVKDKKPYELDVSMKIQGFYQDEPGVFTTTTDDFTEYHKYLVTKLTYDEASQQFTVGEITDRDRFGE